MNIHLQNLIQSSILVLDLLFLNLSIALCQLWINPTEGEFYVEYVRFWVLLNIFWLAVTWFGNVYHIGVAFTFERFSRYTMRGYFYWLILDMFYLFFLQQYILSRLFVVSVFCCFGLSLLLIRFLNLFLQSYLKKNHLLSRKVMIIGYNDMGKKLASYLEGEDTNNEMVGYCEEVENVHELSNYPIVASVDNSIKAAVDYQVEEIYSTIAPEQNHEIYRLMQQADQACIYFRLIPDLSSFVKRNFYINYLKDIPVISLRNEPLTDTGNRLRKRVFDILFSLFILIFFFSWLLPVLALLIYLESPGPIFFVQNRTGKNGKTFRCWKFRSMRVNVDADTRQASLDDSRLTRIGKFIRKTNLDEFPQFLNVLRGEMSVVGPRPHMIKQTNEFSKLIDRYMIRQFLKPGISGWAQVNGYRGETKTLERMEGRVAHDIWYMENWSLWLDVRIILLTIYITLKGDDHAF